MFAAPAAAQTTGPDPVGGQQAEVHDAIFSCGRPVGDEIVVCGDTEAAQAEEDARYRLPLAVERDGEAAGGPQRRALDADSSRCTAVGRGQQCTRGLGIVRRRF
jgi:hypothetical protein